MGPGPRPDGDRSWRPRWLRYAWFLGTPPPLSRRQWRVLGLVSIVSLFEQYDVYLFALNLKHIQADLGLAESQLGLLGSLVRAGTLPALLVTLAADRLGRRRVLLATVVAYTVLTGATALAPDAASFVAFQFLARTFATAETLLAVVVIAEELEPEHRGWGIGALLAIMACGAGLAAVMFSLVEVLPFGWRSLYAIGLGPLVLVAYWRRTLPETGRFVELQRERSELPRATPALQPVLDLARIYPLRFALIASVALAGGMAGSPAGFFAPKYLQDAHGWSPGGVAALNFFGGALAILANPFAGRLSDRRGRRPVLLVFGCAWIAAAAAFYNVSGPALALLWVLMIFSVMGTDVTIAAIGAELFPTSYRSTATGARAAANTVGGVVGLALVTPLYAWLGSNWSAVTLLLAVGVLIPLVVLAFPETAGRSLEEIAPEREESSRPAPVPGGVHVPR